ncbi:MAG TPA: class I SAM-dependent methyltransferase [Candidatus Melainabacteria bacterium]|jgi:cyclopropane-fatty-acyl-phospholipid synthase|nr:class I SAM-dependent methyltransferase [Candidatus Melainabacteria bacterium]HIN64873.1 class I SAM-dependent methyltransferase [Candidatus Obscuribacterales bacterium]
MPSDWIYKALATDLVPEWVIRAGIRNMLAEKLRTEAKATTALQRQCIMDFVQDLKASPIAIHTDAANRQHYEVPARFFQAVLGPRLKYSSALWLANTDDLAQAELNMLEIYCQRADLRDGQTIMELGCGWGSLTLFLAEKYRHSNIVAVSNSHSQKEFIDNEVKLRGLDNVTVVTANIANYDTEREFDRVISIEMFEHLKNYQAMLAKVSRWLRPDGKLFIHIFTHKHFAYHYEDKDGTDWLTRNFFEGGTMPSEDLLLYFQEDVRIVDQWSIPGTHYQKTAEAWLERMKNKRPEVLEIMAETYGSGNAVKWWAFWKLFFLACAELWGYRNGSEWTVSHYLFERQKLSRNIDRGSSRYHMIEKRMG